MIMFQADRGEDRARLSRAGAQPYPRRALEQVRGRFQGGPRLPVLGAGHQHREDLFLVE
jgi:hypothetical protein